MASKNTQTNAPTSAQPTDGRQVNGVPVVSLYKALNDESMLGMTSSSFFVAKKRHEYLRTATHKLISEETGREFVVIEVPAMQRYIAERRQGSGGSHGGAKKLVVFLTDEERAVAEQVLSERFGRAITLDRLYKGKGRAESTDADAAESTDDADDEADEA